jgi:probable HAF family extracellular repeat protein
VVGSAELDVNQWHAFLWTQAGGMVDLGTLGGSHSYATAVNGSGQVVGHSATANGTRMHAFVWTQAGGMIDLGTPVLTSSYAWRINESGQMVGGSMNVPGQWRATLWIPVGVGVVPGG